MDSLCGVFYFAVCLKKYKFFHKTYENLLKLGMTERLNNGTISRKIRLNPLTVKIKKKASNHYEKNKNCMYHGAKFK